MLRDPVDRMYSAYWYYGCLYGLYQAWGMSDAGFDRYASVSCLLWPRLDGPGR